MAHSLDLSGRVALVTGASGGLGAQFAKTLSHTGIAVCWPVGGCGFRGQGQIRSPGRLTLRVRRMASRGNWCLTPITLLHRHRN